MYIMQSKERKFLKLKKQMINYYKTKLADYLDSETVGY